MPGKNTKNAKKAKEAAGEGKDTREGATPPIPAKTSKRPYSVVVWGATGFTGSLLCKEIANVYPVRPLRPTQVDNVMATLVLVQGSMVAHIVQC
jgi:hypothetical protein